MIHAPELVAHEAALAPLPKGAPRPGWEGRPFVVAMVLLGRGRAHGSRNAGRCARDAGR